MASFSCGEEMQFSAAAEAHPSMVDPKDAARITIPTCVVASGNEDANAVKSFIEALNVPSYHETLSDQVHIAARCDLKNERARANFSRGYQILIDFL